MLLLKATANRHLTWSMLVVRNDSLNSSQAVLLEKKGNMEELLRRKGWESAWKSCS
jgi:hypothetical protein